MFSRLRSEKHSFDLRVRVRRVLLPSAVAGAPVRLVLVRHRQGDNNSAAPAADKEALLMRAMRAQLESRDGGGQGGAGNGGGEKILRGDVRVYGEVGGARERGSRGGVEEEGEEWEEAFNMRITLYKPSSSPSSSASAGVVAGGRLTAETDAYLPKHFALVVQAAGASRKVLAAFEFDARRYVTHTHERALALELRREGDVDGDGESGQVEISSNVSVLTLDVTDHAHLTERHAQRAAPAPSARISRRLGPGVLEDVEKEREEFGTGRDTETSNRGEVTQGNPLLGGTATAGRRGGKRSGTKVSVLDEIAASKKAVKKILSTLKRSDNEEVRAQALALTQTARASRTESAPAVCAAAIPAGASVPTREGIVSGGESKGKEQGDDADDGANAGAEGDGSRAARPTPAVLVSKINKKNTGVRVNRTIASDLSAVEGMVRMLNNALHEALAGTSAQALERAEQERVRLAEENGELHREVRQLLLKAELAAEVGEFVQQEEDGTEIEVLRAEKDNLEADHRRARAASVEMKDSLDLVRVQLESERQRAETMRARYDTANAEKTALETKLRNANDTVRALEASLQAEQSASSVAKSEAGTLQARVTELEMQVQAQDGHSASVLRSELASAQGREEVLIAERNDLQDRLEEMGAELRERTASMSAIIKEKEDTAAAHQARLNEMEEERSRRQADYDTASRELDSKIEELASEVDSYKEMDGDLRAQLEGAMAHIREASGHVKTEVEAKTRLEEEMEAVLQAHQQVEEELLDQQRKQGELQARVAEEEARANRKEDLANALEEEISGLRQKEEQLKEQLRKMHQHFHSWKYAEAGNDAPQDPQELQQRLAMQNDRIEELQAEVDRLLGELRKRAEQQQTLENALKQADSGGNRTVTSRSRSPSATDAPSAAGPGIEAGHETRRQNGGAAEAAGEQGRSEGDSRGGGSGSGNNDGDHDNDGGEENPDVTAALESSRQWEQVLEGRVTELEAENTRLNRLVHELQTQTDAEVELTELRQELVQAKLNIAQMATEREALRTKVRNLAGAQLSSASADDGSQPSHIPQSQHQGSSWLGRSWRRRSTSDADGNDPHMRASMPAKPEGV